MLLARSASVAWFALSSLIACGTPSDTVPREPRAPREPVVAREPLPESAREPVVVRRGSFVDAPLEEGRKLWEVARDAFVAGDRELGRRATLDGIHVLTVDQIVSTKRATILGRLRKYAEREGEREAAALAYQRATAVDTYRKTLASAPRASAGHVAPEDELFKVNASGVVIGPAVVEASTKEPGVATASGAPSADPDETFPDETLPDETFHAKLRAAIDAPIDTSDPEELDARIAELDRLVEQGGKDPANDGYALFEAQLKLIELFYARGRLDEAKDLYAQVLAAYFGILAKGGPSKHDPRLGHVRDLLAPAALRQGDFSTALDLYRESERSIREAESNSSSAAAQGSRSSGDVASEERTSAAREGQVEALIGLGDLSSAQALAHTVVQARESARNGDAAATERARSRFRFVLDGRRREADDLAARGKVDEALAVHASIAASARDVRAAHAERIGALERSAALLERACRLEEALVARKEVAQVLSGDASTERDARDEAERRVAALLRVLGRDDEARVLERTFSR